MLGSGQDDKTIQPEGLRASAMNELQRAMLLDLISEWTGIVHESAAAARMAEIKAEPRRYFGSHGAARQPLVRDATAHPTTEFRDRISSSSTTPQEQGGDPSMHVHTIYRDPANDYGRKFTAK